MEHPKASTSPVPYSSLMMVRSAGRGGSFSGPRFHRGDGGGAIAGRARLIDESAGVTWKWRCMSASAGGLRLIRV